MCCLKALLLLNFPVAVFLNRLAAPRCVFSLGILIGSWLQAFGSRPALAFGLEPRAQSLKPSFLLFGLRRPLDLALGRRFPSGALRQDRVHLVPFLARRGLRDRQLAEV